MVAGGVHFGPTMVNYVRHIARAGIDISGHWVIGPTERTEDGSDLRKQWTTEIEIKQLGKAITGSALAKPYGHDSRPVRYRIIGSFENGYLDAIFRDLDKSRFSVSLFLLKIENSGISLKGHRIFSGAIEDRSRAAECTID